MTQNTEENSSSAYTIYTYIYNAHKLMGFHNCGDAPLWSQTIC